MPRTLVIEGKEIVAAISRFQSNIKKRWCACVDSSIPAFSMSEAIRKGYVDAKDRGIRIRYVTEITAENLANCKALMRFVELRHLDGVKGSFAVSEGEFVAGITGKSHLEKLVYSDVLELVTHQQEVFETLWTASAPGAERIKQLK